eukprot:PLAT3662.2.p2 GENE.PLAT3662.2~~PLAT3662.2.p2  ORF type:complete len:346 (+),score=165.47 PLAT3662.2:1560-2597(+)
MDDHEPVESLAAAGKAEEPLGDAEVLPAADGESEDWDELDRMLEVEAERRRSSATALPATSEGAAALDEGRLAEMMSAIGGRDLSTGHSSSMMAAASLGDAMDSALSSLSDWQAERKAHMDAMFSMLEKEEARVEARSARRREAAAAEEEASGGDVDLGAGELEAELARLRARKTALQSGTRSVRAEMDSTRFKRSRFSDKEIARMQAGGLSEDDIASARAGLAELRLRAAVEDSRPSSAAGDAAEVALLAEGDSELTEAAGLASQLDDYSSSLDALLARMDGGEAEQGARAGSAGVASVLRSVVGDDGDGEEDDDDMEAALEEEMRRVRERRAKLEGEERPAEP